MSFIGFQGLSKKAPWCLPKKDGAQNSTSFHGLQFNRKLPSEIPNHKKPSAFLVSII